MKLPSITAICLAACSLIGPARADDTDDAERGQPAPRYVVTVLRSLGGISSLGTSINNRGWVAGRSRVSSNQSIRSEERRVGKECIPPCRSRWSPYH